VHEAKLSHWMVHCWLLRHQPFFYWGNLLKCEIKNGRILNSHLFGHHGVKFCPPKKHWFQSFAPFILYIFGHNGVKFCPPKKHWFQLLEARKKKEEGKVARLLYFASIGSQKIYKMMIKNLCFIF